MTMVEEEVLVGPWPSPFSVPSAAGYYDEDEDEVALQLAWEAKEFLIQIFEYEKYHTYADTTGSSHSVEEGKRDEKGYAVVITPGSQMSVQP